LPNTQRRAVEHFQLINDVGNVARGSNTLGNCPQVVAFLSNHVSPFDGRVDFSIGLSSSGGKTATDERNREEAYPEATAEIGGFADTPMSRRAGGLARDHQPQVVTAAGRAQVSGVLLEGKCHGVFPFEKPCGGRGLRGFELVGRHPSEQVFGVCGSCEHMFDFGGEQAYAHSMTSAQPAPQLTDRQRGILDFIEINMRERGYPPSVREIGEAVGLSSSATVHNHLATLQKMGYLHRDPTKPRAIEVRYEAATGVAMERRPTKHVPLVGDVAAGVNVLAQENVEELVPLPMDFTGDGELFMLRVRGNSMVDAGILDGDFVVCRQQSTANNGDVVVAGIPGEEATIKTFSKRGNQVTLTPSNSRMKPMTFSAEEVSIYGKLVTVMRRL